MGNPADYGAQEYTIISGSVWQLFFVFSFRKRLAERASF